MDSRDITRNNQIKGINDKEGKRHRRSETEG